MAEAHLIACSGARRVTREDLMKVACPEPSGRHFPVPHARLVQACEASLSEAGFLIRTADFALDKGDQRLFATYTLASEVTRDAVLAVALRSSLNRSLPLGLVAGTQVLCCSNLQFRSDILSVRRLHTRHGEKRFLSDIATAIKTNLPAFRDVEARRILAMQQAFVTDQMACHALLTALDQGIIGIRQLEKVWGEWKAPSYVDFERQGKTQWTLLQAFTTCMTERLKDGRFPEDHAKQTIRLQAMLAKYVVADAPGVQIPQPVLVTP